MKSGRILDIAAILAFLYVACAAHAQEPTKAIVPADPISVAVRTPITPTASNSIDPGAPMIYPDPRPLTMKLGRIARQYRAAHVDAPKAVKVANDETPIVAEEVKQ